MFNEDLTLIRHDDIMHIYPQARTIVQAGLNQAEHWSD